MFTILLISVIMTFTVNSDQTGEVLPNNPNIENCYDTEAQTVHIPLKINGSDMLDKD